MFLQLRVVIYDSMYPRLKATGDVVINVARNPFAPQFSPNADYRATVQENVTLGYQVLDIDATDSDNVSWTHCLLIQLMIGFCTEILMRI